MTRILTFFNVTLLSFAFVLGLFAVGPPASVQAHHCLGHADGSEKANGNIAECIDAGACLDTAGQGGNCQDKDTLGNDIDGIVKTIVNILSIVVGIVAVIMIIIGGLKFVTSGGDSANVSSARNTILYAVIGIVIVALAQIIVRFVFTTATNPAQPSSQTTTQEQ